MNTGNIVTWGLITGFDIIIIKILNKMADTQQQAAEKLNAVTTQLEKVQNEIQALKEAAENSGNVSAELQAAIDRVVSAAQVTDDQIEDTPTPPQE